MVRLCLLCCWLLSGVASAFADDEGAAAMLKVARSRFELTADEVAVVQRVGDEQRVEGSQHRLTIRADVIAFLCKNRDTLALVPTRGLRFEDLVISGTLDLSFAKLGVPLSFENCQFDRQAGRLSLRQGNFLSLSLSQCTDLPGINGRGVSVEHSFIFESECLAEIDLKNADIGNDLYFEGAVLNVSDPETRSCLYGRNARISGDVILDRATTNGRIDLQGVSIGGMFSAQDARFEMPASDPTKDPVLLDLSGATVGREVDFDGSLIGGLVRLSDADVTKAVKLHQNKGGSRPALDLSGLSCSRLVLDATARPQWGHLKLHGCNFGDINIVEAGEKETETYLNWVRSATSVRFSEQPYEHLASVLKKQGKDDIARALLIAKVEDSPTRSTVDVLLRDLSWMVGYGYSPLRAVWLALAVIVMGFAVFRTAYQRGMLVVKANNAPAKLKTPNLTLLMYSVDVFVPLVDFGVGPTYVPGKVDTGMEAREVTLFRVYYWFHVAAGWLICTVAVAGLTGLLRV